MLFVVACLTLGLQQSGVTLFTWAPLAFVLPGGLLLLGAAVQMAAETAVSHKVVMEEIDAALSRLDRKTADELRAAEPR